MPARLPADEPPSPLGAAPGRTREGASPRAFRVLVAEDNRTNKMVAAGMLRLLGGRCTLVSNGREAVEAMREARFDLVLMDCSMPEMDGYEATALVRAAEEPQGLRTPIVAMTANAQRGDGEKCLAAGMDDHLPKPVTLAALREKVERWLEGRVLVEPAIPWMSEALSDTDPVPALDRGIFDKLREALGTSLHEAVGPFLEDVPEYLEHLARAVEEGDASTARAVAHAIKGCSANLGALALAALARHAQDLAEGLRLAELHPLLPPLHEAFDQVAALLGAEIESSGTHPARAREATALVMVVDDDRSTRRALRHTLQRDGFRVEEASDGTQALTLLDHVQPDVILMDAVMPVMDGFTACARVKAHPQGAHVPVLMTTALEDNSSVERAFAAGASDYIPKPIHFAVLSQRVRSIIDAGRAERHIRHLAYNDGLTGLPNRALFLEQLGRRLDEAARTDTSVAVLYLDLDRFKYVNDTLGHATGDRLLVAVGHRIRRTVRQADCVARLGGDEFIVALTDSAIANAATAATHICRTLTSPFQIDGNDIFIAGSIGISLFPQDGRDVGTLLRHADAAMYKAKKANTGFQFFEEAMEQSLSGHVRMENDLRRAIERRELEVFYQPKASVGTLEVVGMEALVRWRHPARGLVGPNEFIPLAEETGLIQAIGEFVLRTACAQACAWAARGLPPLPVAVNLSGRQLQQPDFVGMVEIVLHETGLPPRLLELEITESTLMEDAESTLVLLRRLRDLGVRLSIDDFGTGYSSLAYLKRFPMNTLKIDRAFVRDLPGDPDDVAIVSAIVALAHSLRLEVVAEGVETEDQRAFLVSAGCDLVQGYLLSKPVPADEFEEAFLCAARQR